MKKFLKILLIDIIIISLGISYVFSFSYTYKDHWNLKIENPIKTQVIFEDDLKDVTRFQKLYYTSNQINKMIKNNNFSIIDKQDIENIIEKFCGYLNEKDKKILNDSFDFGLLNNPSNKYIYKQSDLSSEFILLIMDVDNNVIYEFVVYF